MVRSPLLKVSWDNNQTQFTTGFFHSFCCLTSVLFLYIWNKTLYSKEKWTWSKTKNEKWASDVERCMRKVLADIEEELNPAKQSSTLELIRCLYCWCCLWRNLMLSEQFFQDWDNAVHWQIVTVPIPRDHFDLVFLSIPQSLWICADIFPWQFLLHPTPLCIFGNVSHIWNGHSPSISDKTEAQPFLTIGY